MNRREALHCLIVAGGTAAIGGSVVSEAVGAAALRQAPARRLDPMFVWQWQMAQRQRPAGVASSARIAAGDEPGEPLIIQGQLFHADGVTPAVGSTVFAYHTDRTGIYAPRGASRARPWRLRGWARTDHDGRFTFQTIRPAPYPTRDESAHVHLTAEGPGITAQVVESLRFAGDPLTTPAQLAAADALGRFSPIRPVVNGRCDLALRLTGEWPF